MKYKTSDIITKALQIADLTNSDFISWYEKVSMINDAYTMLYQKLIDIGDGSFVNDFIATYGENVLPPDFWQIKCINMVNNKTVTPVKRRADSEGYNTLSYEVRFDKLYINGTPCNSGDIVVSYWAKPKTLTFKPNVATLSPVVQDGFTVKAVYDGMFFSVKIEENTEETTEENVTTRVTSSTSTINIYDTKSDTDKEVVIDGIIDKIITSENKAVIKSHQIVTTEIITTIVDPETEEESTTTETSTRTTNSQKILTYVNLNLADLSGVPVIMENGTIAYLLNKQIFIGNHLVADFDYEGTLDLIVANNELYDFWWIDGERNIYHNGDKVELNGQSIEADKILYKHGDCWYETDEEVGFIDGGDNVHFVDDKPGLLGINKIDENTGYGYTVLNFDNTYKCYPWVDDTVLDFPNSMYFQIMSYMLGVQFKIKQGADASGIQSILSSMEQTFYDTLSQDANQPIRIKNVY